MSENVVITGGIYKPTLNSTKNAQKLLKPIK